MDRGLERVLIDGAEGLGAGLDSAALERFSIYLEELEAWNRRMSLTSITGERDIVIKHFLDSLTPIKFIEGADSVLDIGAGAGFPGLPMKIARPGLRVVLVDSVAKKVHFMRHIIRRLSLAGDGGAEAVHSRAEDPALVERYASNFACVISRAFTDLGEFVSLALPYARPGGVIVAMKGPGVARELGAFEDAPREAAAGVEPPATRLVECCGRRTTLVVFRKRAA
ncbi:MAG: 16S rRNA (guanine(527)-N(7))-methyltransferase RsmG [Thermodesulfobacteriota bacterium]